MHVQRAGADESLPDAACQMDRRGCGKRNFFRVSRNAAQALSVRNMFVFCYERGPAQPDSIKVAPRNSSVLDISVYVLGRIFFYAERMSLCTVLI